MAYNSRNTNTEHASKTIIKTIDSAEKSGMWPRLILLCGKEEFLVDWSKNYIKEKVISNISEAMDYSAFGDENLDIYEIISACETLPLMSAKKMVVVNSNELFALQPKGVSSESIESLVKYVPKISESTILVFCCSKPNKTKAIYKAVANNGLVYDFAPLDDATLAGWMVKRLNAASKKANTADLLTFAKACGYADPERNYNLNNLENDLKKIIALSENEFITLDEMMEVSSAQGELNAFKLLDSALSGRKNDAFNILNSTLQIQMPSKEMGAILSFLGLLCSQLELMLCAREREEEGQSFYEILSGTGANEYRLKKVLSAARNKSVQELRKSLDSAFQVEKDIKSGNLNQRTALELFIANL